jgi:hypothetical protein
MARFVLLVLLPVLAACGAGPGVRGTPADWAPAAWAEEETVTLGTSAPGSERYWFPVWLAVVDDQLYVRLGRKASDRVERNGPVLGVRIAGREFDRVRWEPVPELAPRVASAIADKYWSDVFIGWVNHPLTVRLRPE